MSLTISAASVNDLIADPSSITGYSTSTAIVIEGQMNIRFREGEVSLTENEMYVVPKGVEHMPIATNECKILLIEPKGIINTGYIKNQLTVKKETWI